MKSPKNSSPSSHDSSRGASCRSQSPSSSGGGISPKKIWIKKYHDEYISFDQDIRTSTSFKLFSKDSINSKEVVKMNPSQSPLCSSISEEKLTPETESGESKYLSFVTPKQLSPSISVCIKDFSEGFVNPESKYALQSPQNSNISDEKISQTKGKAKEGYAKILIPEVLS
ncbi:hypothetical protein TNIN_295331 [Trichonephila inaurata madagascariensis]|uniref:Uncharacterized protein n=1 Tax=Trichonephila inaurata madagascariensis TaxID=2747483 RepID=A0A8X6YS84_9ARAC|nr:hypothetical protein TNIN_295331 [Trichonephila inaurata madagascariensis]